MTPELQNLAHGTPQPEVSANSTTGLHRSTIHIYNNRRGINRTSTEGCP